MSNQFLSKDKLNNPITIAWQKTTITSPEFATAMANVWDVAREAYVSVEMNFLRALPSVVGKEPYFKAFEPLFVSGSENIDWNAAEVCMTDILKSHFVFDPSKFNAAVIKMFADDTCYFVAAKDASTQKTVGFITVLLRKNYVQGDVKIMSFAVDPHHQNRGLGKLLMSTVFKIMPDVQRIFLCTRVTNETAIKAYCSWGFATDQSPVMDHAFNVEHWTFMEYKTNQSDVLQKVAKDLIDF